MSNKKLFVEALKSCFFYLNTPVQFLATTSLLLFQDKQYRDFNAKKLLNQINNSAAGLKNEIFNHRLFYILSKIKLISYKPGIVGKKIFVDDQKKNKKNYIKSKETIIIEKILMFSVQTKNTKFLEKKKIEIFQILCEIKRNFLIIDWFGFLEFDEKIKNYILETSSIEIQLNKLCFHLFRKIKNFTNFFFVQDTSEKDRINCFFEDRLIKKKNFSEVIIFFLERNAEFLENWRQFIRDTNKIFFHQWLSNVLMYKTNLEKIFLNDAFLKQNKNENNNNLKNCLKINTKSFSMFKLKKFRKFPYYSINDFDDQSFVQYGKSFSNFFENLNYFNDKLWHKKWYTNGFSKFNFSQFQYEIIGFVFFKEILNGILELKKKLIKLKKNQIIIGFERKVIFSLGLIGSKCNSIWMFDFLVTKVHKQDLKIFLTTGNFNLFKNLTFLFLSLSQISCNYVKKFIGYKLKEHGKNLPVEDTFLYMLRTVILFLLKKYSKKYFIKSTLKKKNHVGFINKLLIVLLISICTIQKNDLNNFISTFSREIISFSKMINSISILNREQDFLFRFLPLIFSMKSFGTENLENLCYIEKNLVINKSYQQLFKRMFKYCAFFGKIKKDLVSAAIKEIKIFESLKTKKIERILIIQEKFKKIRITPLFSSIYDLNTDYETNRPFIYFKINIEGSILGLCLLAFGDTVMSKLIYRIQSFFLSSHCIEYSSFSILSTAFLFMSNNECPAIDFIIKLTGSKEFLTIKNSVFALGLIGFGTNNTRIKNALKCLANYYDLKLQNNFANKRSDCNKDDFQFFRKLKAILFLIRLAQGMVNSTFHDLSHINFLTGRIDKFDLGTFLFSLFSFNTSNFFGYESIFTCFYLFELSIKSKFLCSFDKDFKISSLKIKNTCLKTIKKKYILTPCYL